MQQVDGFTPVHYCCHKGSLKMLQLLLEYEGDLKRTSNKGVTCLHLAAAAGKLQIVSYLLDQPHLGFSIQLRTLASRSLAVHVAAKGGQIEVLQFLVEEKGADPTQVDKNQEDSLTLAIKSKQQEVGTYLVISDRFNIERINKRTGFNYFAYAVVKGQIAIAKALVQKSLE